MLTIRYENSFKRDYRRIVRRGYDPGMLEAVIAVLAEGEPLPLKYRDHPLSGNFKGFRECHVAPDWLLIYRIDAHELVLILTRRGTHSDLFL